MMKRGKCPSFVTGNNGRPVFEVAERKRKCKRCSAEILKGEQCVNISTPGRMGGRTYCCSCLGEIINQSRKDLDKLEQKIKYTQ